MLNVRQIESCSGPKVLTDGQGLRLEVDKSQNKKWIFRFTLNQRRRDMGLGRFPDIGLREARNRRDEARKLVAQGQDPIALRRRARAEQRVTFEFAAEQFIQSKQGEWKKRQASDNNGENTLDTYAMPKLGGTLVKDIDVQDVLHVIEPIWHSKTETAKRVRGRIEKVLGWAIAMGHRTSHNPAVWTGLLENLLPSPAKIAPPVHHAAMQLEQIPQFYRWLKGESSVLAAALRFLILTIGRTSQVTGARWDEIKVDEKLWSVPANRMKSGKAHDVPLSAEALHLLELLPRVADSPYLFPGLKANSPVNANSMRLFLRKKLPHLSVTVHGFRSTFRDWAEEQNVVVAGSLRPVWLTLTQISQKGLI